MPPGSKTVGPLSLQAHRPSWDSLFLLILLRLQGVLNILNGVDEDQRLLELHLFFLSELAPVRCSWFIAPFLRVPARREMLP